MNKYLESLNEEIREYLKILSPEFPEWLLEYIYTPEMLRVDGIGNSCGTNYTKLLHIQKYCKEINENLEFFGNNFNTFQTNNIFRDSISMKVFQIGELAKELDRVDKKYIEKTKKDIPWQSIIRMRERFAHHYGEMDLKMIFNTANFK